MVTLNRWGHAQVPGVLAGATGAAGGAAGAVIYHGCPCSLPIGMPGPGSAAALGGAGCPAEAPRGRDACERRQGRREPVSSRCAAFAPGGPKPGTEQEGLSHVVSTPGCISYLAPCAVAVQSTALPDAVGCHGGMQDAVVGCPSTSIGAVLPHHRAGAGFAELICCCPCPAVALPAIATTWACASHCH